MAAHVQAEYEGALASLTTSDRVKITFLTQLAEDYLPSARVVADVIINRIMNSHGSSIHLLHLMDSICKVVQKEYISIFATEIPAVFAHIYRTSNATDRQRAIRVRDTWGPFFPPDVLAAIDASIDQIEGRVQHQPMVMPAPLLNAPLLPAPQMPPMQVQQPYHDPAPFVAPMEPAYPPAFGPPQIELPEMIPAVLDPLPIPALRTLKQDAIDFFYKIDAEIVAGPPPRQRHIDLLNFQDFLKVELDRIDAEILHKEKMAQRPIVPPHDPRRPSPADGAVPTAPMPAMVPPAAPPVPPVVPGAAMLPPPAHHGALLPRPPALLPGGPGLLPGVRPPLPPPQLRAPRMTFAKEDLNRREEYFVRKLYDQGLKCHNCGMRFPSDAKSLFEKHYDWHFRMNKVKKETLRCRNWLLPEADWIKFTSGDDAMDVTKEDIQGAAAGAVAEVVQTVPVDDDKNCGICGERFEEEFQHELDEWHFKDALRNEAGTFHVQCFRDAEKSGTLPSPIGVRSQRASISEDNQGPIPFKRDASPEPADAAMPTKKFRP